MCKNMTVVQTTNWLILKDLERASQDLEYIHLAHEFPFQGRKHLVPCCSSVTFLGGKMRAG